MKRIFCVVIIMFIFSGCILLPENPATPVPASDTQTTDVFSPTATTKPGDDQKTPSPSDIIALTKTSVLTQSPTSVNTPQFTATPFPIRLQSGSPAYIKNFAHTAEGYDWLGVAGQVFNEEGKPLLNKVVIVKGKVDEKLIESVGMTGVPEADIYGPGGYEIQISDTIFNSEDLLSIQVFDLNGVPISDAIFFDTFADCGKNLAIINFQYTRLPED